MCCLLCSGLVLSCLSQARSRAAVRRYIQLSVDRRTAVVLEGAFIHQQQYQLLTLAEGFDFELDSDFQSIFAFGADHALSHHVQ